MENDYKVVDSGKGKLRFELVNPGGSTIAVFRTKAQADASLAATKKLQFRTERSPISRALD
jgi:hypothetical protein